MCGAPDGWMPLKIVDVSTSRSASIDVDACVIAAECIREGRPLGYHLADARTRPMSSPLRVAILGAGTVGREVARALLDHPDALAPADGSSIALVGVAVRDVGRAERSGIPGHLLT